MHGLQYFDEFVEPFGFFVGQIILFQRVFLDVIEFERFVAPYLLHLPRPIAQSPLLARKFLVQVAVARVKVLSIKEGRHVDAVDIVRKKLTASCQPCERWHEVRKVDELIGLPYRYTSGLVDDERDFDAPFVELSFVSFQSSAAVEVFDGCHDSSTIVAGKDDDCVFSDS